MNKEEFYHHACIEAIHILKPCYWDNTSYNTEGADTVADFARKLTNKVFGETYVPQSAQSIIDKIAQAKKDLKNADNQILAYELQDRIMKLTDELVALYEQTE